MKIDVYCNDGSPMGITPSDIYGRGVGGAELSLMSWAETMAAIGHEVSIFNNPKHPGVHAGVSYRQCNEFNPSVGRDVFIAFRSPNRHTRHVKAGIKVHWSTDQYTIGNFARDVFPFVDKVVTISPFHTAYHVQRYGVDPDKIHHIDLGVNLSDYEEVPHRDNNACLFASVPDRGLGELATMWGDITARRPETSLTITSDYTLWGAVSSGTARYRRLFLRYDNVTYHGSVPRKLLVDIQQKSGVLAYPCIYDELFCITVAEAQVAGCIPVTPPIGALGTTNEWGIITPPVSSPSFKDEFMDAVVRAMDAPDNFRSAMMANARRRFDWMRICREWEYLFQNNDFAPVGFRYGGGE